MARIAGVDLPRDKRISANVHLRYWEKFGPADLSQDRHKSDTKVRDLTERGITSQKKSVAITKWKATLGMR